MDTERRVLNTGVYWGEMGRASGTGRWGGIAWGEMPNVGEGEKKKQNTLPCVYLCNCLACSAHVPPNLKCNKKLKKKCETLLVILLSEMETLRVFFELQVPIKKQ